jgi:membrane protein implicated in regulation of membrane protease activity
MVVAEIFTSGFVLLWFGVGALAAALAALVGVDSPAAQFLIFLLVAGSLTAASRTIFANYFVHDGEESELKTGAAALPGQVAVVTQDSAGTLQAGAVKVLGSVWTAYPVAGELPLQAGEKVLVERVSGATLHVRRMAEPEWRKLEGIKDEK